MNLKLTESNISGLEIKARLAFPDCRPPDYRFCRGRHLVRRRLHLPPVLIRSDRSFHVSTSPMDRRSASINRTMTSSSTPCALSIKHRPHVVDDDTMRAAELYRRYRPSWQYGTTSPAGMAAAPISWSLPQSHWPTRGRIYSLRRTAEGNGLYQDYRRC